MTISSAGLFLIERFEGIKLQAYEDGNGKWTIGYGHTSGVSCGQFETKEKAEVDLCLDVKTAEDGVRSLVRRAPFQGEYDALVSFTYNEGVWRLRNSALLRLFNLGNVTAAARAFGSWAVIAGKHSEGLEQRRQAEVALFTSPQCNSIHVYKGRCLQYSHHDGRHEFTNPEAIGPGFPFPVLEDSPEHE